MGDRERCLGNPIIAQHLEAIRVLCREYPDDYDSGPWLARQFALEEALGHVMGRLLDVVLPGALRNT